MARLRDEATLGSWWSEGFRAPIFIRLTVDAKIGARTTLDFPRGAMPGYQGSEELFCMDAREPLVHET